jgi:hypothetical protein
MIFLPPRQEADEEACPSSWWWLSPATAQTRVFSMMVATAWLLDHLHVIAEKFGS